MRSRGSRWRREFCENPHRMNKPRLILTTSLALLAGLASSLPIFGSEAVLTDDTTANLVLGIAALVEHAASVMTLHPGDVIFSGTPPPGLGPVVPGDVMHIEMDGLGEMTVQVRGGPGRKTPLDGMEPDQPAG